MPTAIVGDDPAAFVELGTDPIGGDGIELSATNPAAGCGGVESSDRLAATRSAVGVSGTAPDAVIESISEPGLGGGLESLAAPYCDP